MHESVPQLYSHSDPYLAEVRTFGNGRLWAVGSGGTILGSLDGQHWNNQAGGTKEGLNSIFGTSDGKVLWVVGESGTILRSGDSGKHWKRKFSGTNENLNSIFGISDGKHLWVVTDKSNPGITGQREALEQAG
jgi:photosystem II stability/assembly factor-like uncharacterized protein